MYRNFSKGLSSPSRLGSASSLQPAMLGLIPQRSSRLAAWCNRANRWSCARRCSCFAWIRPRA